ncbi:hypothetical protein Q4195_18840, partial [Acinetobacter baumannii]
LTGLTVDPTAYIYNEATRSIQFTTAPTDGSDITIERDTTVERTIQYETYNNSFRPDTLNYDFDRIWRVLQEKGIESAKTLSGLISILEQLSDSDRKIVEAMIEQTRLNITEDTGITALIDLEANKRKEQDKLYNVLQQIQAGNLGNELKNYFNTVLATQTPNIFDGIDTGLIFDGDESQKQINEKTVKHVDSIASLLALKNPRNGQTVYVKDYYKGQNEGGGEFELMPSGSLVIDNAIVFKSNQNGYVWVRKNVTTITPEMCGAIKDQDNTEALEVFFKLCGKGIRGLAKQNTVYNTSKLINVVFEKSVTIDFNNSTIKPKFEIAAGTVDGSLLYTSDTGLFKKETQVTINNMTIDLTAFTPVISTSAADRKGIRGLIVNNAETININNYVCKNSFYGSGLMLTSYTKAQLNNISLIDVGMKINPTSDDTGVYDAAGDGIYLGSIVGKGTTTLSNITANSHAGLLGRAGLVVEQFNGVTLEHDVVIRNASFIGYQRVIHQEDHGTATIIWENGRASDFSNLLFNLGGKSNKAYLICRNLDLVVNTTISYGGTTGLQNFQGAGNAYFEKCNIVYEVSVTERGNKVFSDCIINLTNAVVDAAVSTIPHRIENSYIQSDGGYLYYTSTNQGLESKGNTYNSNSNASIKIIETVNKNLNSDKDKFINTYPIAINTTSDNKISNGTFSYSKASIDTLFKGSYVTGFDISNSVLKSTQALLGLYSDGATRYKIHNSVLTNIQIGISQSATEINDYLLVADTRFIYTPAYGNHPMIYTYGTYKGFLRSNTFFDQSNLNLVLPIETTNFKYKQLGNTSVINDVVTLI